MDPMVDTVSTTVSAREAEVLAALGDHLTNAEIAQRLYISVRTVESHVSSLLRKLGAADRRELSVQAGLMKVAPDGSSGAGVPGLVGSPSAWTSFVGRTAELTELSQALSSNRLVTLVGPGGVGKTRLAVEAAERAVAAFPAGGAFVDLVPVSPEFVVHAAATVLGVAERPHESLERVVLEQLRAGPTLLVLDNCEHVLAAAATFVRSVLVGCPETVVLVASRERLGVPGERVITLSPLEVTDAGGGESEASRLFVARAGAVGSNRALITEICRRLEGMPLAIELAAARSSSLGLDGVLAGLDDHLRLLTGSNPSGDRHGSMRTVIDWSHQLLDDRERAVFRRLGTFVGAFDLTAATAVATGGDLGEASDVIGRLTDKSLLVHVPHPAGSRWQMLDSVHAFAHEQLRASGEADEVRRRHHVWATAEARRLEESLGEAGWQERFDLVVGDLRAALHLPATGSNRRDAFDLALALAHLTYARRFLLESRDHYATAAARAPDPPSAVQALRLAASATFAEMRGEAAFELLQEALARATAAGEDRLASIVLADSAALAGRCPALFVTALTREELVALVERARELAPADDPEVATRLAVAAAWDAARGLTIPTHEGAQRAVELAREFGDPVLIGSSLDAAASAAAYDGHFKEAARLSAERLGLLDALPRHDPRVGAEIADIYHMASKSSVGAGDLRSALASARKSYDDDTSRGLPHLAAAFLVTPLVLSGEFDEAERQASVMRQGWERAGQPPAGWMGPSFFAASAVYGLRGDEVAHEEWREAARSIQLDTEKMGCDVFFGCRVALHTGAYDEVSRLAERYNVGQHGLYDPYADAILAELAVVTGAADAASRLDALQGVAEENDFVGALLLRAAGRLHHDEALLEQAVLGWEAIGARFERACTLVLIPSRADEGVSELAALGCAVPND
jgi:predicted ATPase/DNA-binding CsgD family transcriptional regulator